jgi:TatD DNase family protein
VGEIGIDLFRNLSAPDVQRDVFARQLALAADAGRPVIVHDRDAHAEVSAALLGWIGRPGHAARGVLHAFSGDAKMADRLASAGFLVSFALPVAFRSAVGAREAAATLPAGRFLVETDAPYLGPDREGRNEPTTALRVIGELGRLRSVEPRSLVAPIRAAYAALVS